MKNNFNTYKWVSLMSFSMMYIFVYLARFNVNNLMPYVADNIDITMQQQEMISLSVFISYAAGSFVNGYLADRFGAKKIIIIGGIMTSFMNAAVPFQEHWSGLFLIWFINGYFQSMIWVGGISFLSHWWKEGERGKGVGIANFFSGMSHAVAYVIPVMILSVFPAISWKWNFVLPIGLLLIFVALFGIFAVERPEKAGLLPYDSTIKRHRIREEKLRKIYEQGKTPWKYFLSQPKFWWWCCIAAISSVCRYGLLNWIPLYYENELGGNILSEEFSNLTLPVGMAFGTLAITWAAGTKMFNNKGIVITAMAAICGTLIIIFPMIDDVQSVLVGIFFTGFAIYGINGVLWVHAIDQGCRVFAGSVAGIFNGFAYLGACLEGVLFPMVLNAFGNYLAVFILMEVLCILMVLCGMAVSKKNTSIVPEIRE